jgi:biotin carboxyl carrier protein
LGETADITAPHAGCIEEILVPVGEPFHRGQALARMVAF